MEAEGTRRRSSTVPSNEYLPRNFSVRNLLQPQQEQQQQQRYEASEYLHINPNTEIRDDRELRRGTLLVSQRTQNIVENTAIKNPQLLYDLEDKCKDFLKEQKRLAVWRARIIKREADVQRRFRFLLESILEEQNLIQHKITYYKNLIPFLKQQLEIAKKRQKEEEEEREREEREWLERDRELRHQIEQYYAETYRNTPLIEKSNKFILELGSNDVKDESMVLIDAERYTPYYQHYYQNKAHKNYYAELGNKFGPLLVSVESVEKEKLEMFADHTFKIRALVRTKYEDEFVFIDAKAVQKAKVIEKAIEATCKWATPNINIKLIKIKDSSAPSKLAKMEQKFLPKGYKIGLLYCKDEQVSEDEMYSNVNTSPVFEEFLDFIGNRVDLFGYKGYAGGLDVKSTKSTGIHSIVSEVDGYQIMFHVSTLLPYFPEDHQQVERKRHLGNDVCMIVFKDSPEPFQPNIIASEFNSNLIIFLNNLDVICVVTPDYSMEGKRYYRVAFAYKGNMGFATPLLPFPAVFEKAPAFRTYLLKKLINAERMALRGPEFRERLAKTKQTQMQDLIEEVKK